MTGVRFGPFHLDPVEGRLTREGEAIVLQDKAFLFLEALVERPGRLWTREELHARLWPGVFVTDDALFQAVRKARQALGDDPKHPTWIETVTGRGYRFLGSPEAPAPPAPPPLPAQGATRGVRCQAPQTEIVGREGELAELEAHLAAGARLISLIGPAGAGKTTLAQLQGASFGDRSRFVDLLEATDADSILHALGEGLGADSGGPGAAGAVLRALPSGGLVVLDNAELCTRPLAILCLNWLKQAPDVRFLVTSRRPLDLSAERVVSIGPLSAGAGARVFRARAAARGVVLADEERERVDDVVAAVDALPLALELAASRVGLLGLDGLLQRLREPLDVLRTNRADLPERHRSIGAALELSWSALDAVERSFLAGCCVFRGPFRVEDAERVVTRGWLGASALDLTQAVMDASLVRVVQDPSGGRRLAPYVAVRELALELGEARFIEEVRLRHLDWLAGQGTSGDEPGPRDYARLTPLLEDGAQALRFAVERGRRAEAARVAAWLAPVMARRGAGMRALELLALLSPFDSLEPDAELTLSTLQALIVSRSTEPERTSALFDAVAQRAQALDRPRAEAIALLYWADATIGRNVVAARGILSRAAAAVQRAPRPMERAVLQALEARARYHEGDSRSAVEAATAALESLRDPEAGWWAAGVHIALAEFTYLQHQYEGAELSVRQALAVFESAGAPAEIDHALTFLGVIRQAQGRLNEALELFVPLRARARRMGHAQREQHLVYSIGGVYGMLGRIAEARVAFEESLLLCRQQNNVVHEGWTLLRLAGADWRMGLMDQARAWLRQAIRCFEACGRPILMESARTELGRVALICGDLSEAEAELSLAHAQLMRLEQDPIRAELARALWAEARGRQGLPGAVDEAKAAVESLRRSWPLEGLARALNSLGFIHFASGDRVAAQACLDEAEAIRAAVGDTDGDIARDVQRLREAMA